MIKYVYAKERIQKSNITIKVISNCMIPAIATNDEVEVKVCSNYLVGDIVAVFTDQKIRMHRVVRIKKNRIVTKGDNSFDLDKEVSEKEIIGLVHRNISKGCAIRRRRVIGFIIAKLSYIEAKLFRSMRNKRTHKNLKYISKIRIWKKRLCRCCLKYETIEGGDTSG